MKTVGGVATRPTVSAPALSSGYMGFLNDNSSSFSTLWQMVRRLGRLYMSKVRLDLSDKLSRLLSGVALTLIVLILGICVMVFVTLALSAWLTDVLPDYWSYLIIGGFYIVLILLLIALRGPILVNPITRFISRIIVESPQDNVTDDE